MKDLFQNKYRRHSLRLPNWNYRAEGAYFITICTKNKNPFFAKIDHSEQLILSEVGEIAAAHWNRIPEHFIHIALDAFVIMPDHMHGIIIIKSHKMETVPTSLDLSVHPKSEAQLRFRNPGKGSIPTIIGLYKSGVSREARKLNPDFGWKPDYYERIIRGEKEYANVVRYIEMNPEKWIQKRKERKEK